MTYKEHPHRHQSEILPTIPPDYAPYTVGPNGAIFGVLRLVREGLKVSYQKKKPRWGGYLSESKKWRLYGSPSYCPNATKEHRKHLELYGVMPHLVFFRDEKTAQEIGFRACKKCAKKRRNPKNN